MKIMLLLLLTIILPKAHAQSCNINASVANFTMTLISSEQAVAHPIQVSRGSNSTNCQNIRLYFGKGNANSYNRKVYQGSINFSYNIFKESGLLTVLKDQGDATASEYIEGSLPSVNSNIPFNFYLKLIELNSVFGSAPGYYHDLIPIHIYTVRTNGTEDYQTTRYMNVSIIIPRYAELSLGPAGSPHDPNSTSHVMNFGTLTSNDQQMAALKVKGNVPFGIYMSSLNGGKIVNNTSFVPYTIKLGNSLFMSLSTPNQNYYMTQHNSGTNMSGENFNIHVKLGIVPPNATTGDYEDIVTVTVEAW
jgi:spore coat protein U-like protein